MLNAPQNFRVLILTIAALFSLNAAASASFTFDGPDAQGWSVLNYQNGRIFDSFAGPAETTPNGNPTDAILARDPNAVQGARFSAPAPFVGDASSLIGGALMFDLTVAENFDANFYTLSRALGLIYVENATTGQGLLYTGALPDASWTPYSVTLGPNAAPLTLSSEFGGGLMGLPVPDIGFWAYIPNIAQIGASFLDPTAQNFADVFGDVTRFTIVGEVLDGPEDVLGLDNVLLTTVPIPAAFPLMLSALFGVFAAGRRRATVA
ncbi:MAG: hypothetical protein ACI915_003573 [Gammaproteobacteria bacterium]|jgi:hypothetical protein